MKRTTTITVLAVGKPARELPFEWTEREKPKGDNAREVLDWDEGPGLDELRKIIVPLLELENGRPGNLEHVSVLWEGRRTDMFVDDEGTMRGRELPRNEEATAIYRAYWLGTHPGTDPESVAAVYGCALLFRHRVWF